MPKEYDFVEGWSSVDVKNSIDFKDTSGHWAEESIKKMVANGLMNGYEDNTFKPDAPITRGEIAVIKRLLDK